MPSRQDQLHSYQYAQQRVVAALVTHEPDPYRSPLRRAGTTALVSVVLAAIALTAAAIYGALNRADGAKPDSPTTVYLDADTGAAYVLRDGKLHPMANYTSALLAANGNPPKTTMVSRAALQAVPIGNTLGIPGAPGSLPRPSDLLTGGWSICTRNPSAGDPISTLLIGTSPTGGTALGKGRGLLVQDPTGRTFLVMANRRFLVPDDATGLAVGMGNSHPWPVAVAWVNAIAQGPDLVPPSIDGIGDRPDSDQPARVGQLITDGGDQWAVMLPDGPARLTPLQAKLAGMAAADHHLSDIDLGAGFALQKWSKTELIDQRPDGLPQTVPVPADAPARACLTLPVSDAGQGGLRLDAAYPDGVTLAEGDLPSGARADRVFVPRGKGALVVAAASPSAPAGSGTVSVVTDTGLRYALARRELLNPLGFGKVTPAQVPAQLVALVPQGPALDANRATQPAGTG